MFSLGIGLTPADFLRVGTRPASFFIGAFNQVILLPVVAFCVISLFGLTAELAVGVMILAACPGGVTSSIIAKLARADVALSVSLTAVISLASVVTVPLVLSFAAQHFMGSSAPDIDITATALTMFALTAVPIALGLGLRAVAPRLVHRVEPYVGGVATILFAVIVLAALAANWGLFTKNLAVLGPALITLLVVLTALGYFVTRALGRTRGEAKTISIETGVQNGTLGIAIAAIVIGSGSGFSAFALASAVYGILMYLVILPVIFIYRQMD